MSYARLIFVQVKRFQVGSVPSDEIVKQINELVEDLRDKKAEADIQKIYASDAEIQKLYASKKR